jgi:transposase
MLVDARGVPLSIVVTGANRHDVSQLAAVLDGIVVERPDTEQNLCADKGYAGDPAQQAIKDRNYVPHVKQRGEEIQEKKTNPDFKARRWVVEVAHSWLNRFRKLLVRYEKLTERYEALIHMAAAIIAFRKTGVNFE